MVQQWDTDGGESIRQFLYYFYRFMKIPISLVEKERIILSYVPSVINPDPALSVIRPYLDSEITTQYQLIFGFFVGAIHLEGTPYHVLIGPLDSQQNNRSARRTAFLHAVGIDSSENARLRHWLSTTPKVNSTAIIRLFRFLEYTLNGSVSKVQEAQPIPYAEEDFAGLEEGEARYHGSEQSEAQMLHMIREGDREGLLQYLFGLYNTDNMDYGRISEDNHRLQRYLFAVTAALASRSAVQGGMDYEKALTMSDEYIYKMDQLTSINDIPPLMGMMMLAFADEVRKLRLPKVHSRILSQTLSDIRTNIYQPLTVTAIARRLNVSTSHLSHTFSEEMGQDLKTYILKEKIREAEFLLENTDLTIVEISEKLCFSSQPHFQKIFRQITGTTPGKYRSSVQ